MDWHLPPLAHFDYPVKSMARTISKWVTEGQTTLGLQRFKEFKARWVEGKSVLARRRLDDG